MSQRRYKRPMRPAQGVPDIERSAGESSVMNAAQSRPSLISRRTVLRGFGTAISLPLLDAMRPVVRAAQEPARPPVRMAFLYVPNGIHMQAWTPQQEGATFTLPETLAPLAPYQGDLLVLSGLAQVKARPNGDGPGDHARALASFLTGCQARKTDGANIRAGVSVDQVAAARVGQETRFPSLEIGCEPGQNSGGCDSGYSCAYSGNSSWKTESLPMAKEVNPRLVFERLFAAAGAEGHAAAQERAAARKSILDYVLDDANRLQARLGATDGKKLDEYLSGVREIELRIGRIEREPMVVLPDYSKPEGVPSDYGEHLRLMSDLLVLAFQGDLTRVSTFLFANEGSNRSYADVEVPDGHHDLSHHGGDAAKHEKLKKINLFHINQLAYLLGRLRSVPEGEGTLLDNCMIAYGSGIGDGDRHNHDELPILLAGRGGGSIQTGRHLRFPFETPLNNLWLTMLERIGAPVGALGDSSGVLQGLSG